MTDKQIYTLAGEASNYTDRDAFVSDMALSSVWGNDFEEISPYRVKQCGILWDAVNLPFSELRARMNLTQAQMAERLCVPRRTLENWEYRGTCPVYIRILIARVWFGLEGNSRSCVLESGQ